MQNEKLEKIKARIQALSEMTVANGCTEAEAMTAMNMVGKLLQEYNLSMTDVEFGNEEFVTMSYNTGLYNQNALKFVVTTIANFCDCKAWVIKGKQKYNTNTLYNFFGAKPDAEMAVFLYTIISSAFDTETNKFKRQNCVKTAAGINKAKSTSFQKGFINRICQRLRELKNEANKDVKMSNGTSLMVLKGALVDEKYAQMLKDIDLKIKNTKAKFVVKDRNAYNAGVLAANNVNLSRPLNTSYESEEQLLLTQNNKLSYQPLETIKV